MRWLRRRGDRVTITTGKYAGHLGTVEANVYQRTVDYADEFANGYHVMLDTEELIFQCKRISTPYGGFQQ